MLGATLESLAAQTLPTNQYEVVVVDDGSEDATRKVCRDFAPRIQLKYLHIENSGISEDLWNRLSENGVKKTKAHYSVEAAR